MSGQGHSRPGRASSKSGQVRHAAESGNKLITLVARPWGVAVDGAARAVIQAPKPEPRIMRYELSDYE
jgi:hypothetical protein